MWTEDNIVLGAPNGWTMDVGEEMSGEVKTQQWHQQQNPKQQLRLGKKERQS
jgi:hypothetical protein